MTDEEWFFFTFWRHFTPEHLNDEEKDKWVIENIFRGKLSTGDLSVADAQRDKKCREIL